MAPYAAIGLMVRVGVGSIALLKAETAIQPGGAMSDFPGNVAWDLDQGLDAASALDGERLLLGRPVVMDDSSPRYLEAVEGGFFAVPPTKHLLTIGPAGSGKRVSQVIPNLLTYFGPAVVVDIGGQSAWVTAERRRQRGGKVVIVDPFNLQETAL